MGGVTLSDRYPTDDAIYAMLRRQVGHSNDTVLLSDELLEDALYRALDTFNGDFPLVSVGTFTTTVDVQAYTPAPTGAYALRNVYWPISSECGDEAEAFYNDLQPLLGNVIDEIGTRTLDDPSRLIDLERRSQWTRALMGEGAETAGMTVYLNPVPKRSGKTVFFSYYTARFTTWSAVAVPYLRGFLNLVESIIHETLANGPGAITRIDDTNEGVTLTTNQSAQHASSAARLRTSYRRGIPPPRSPRAFP